MRIELSTTGERKPSVQKQFGILSAAVCMSVVSLLPEPAQANDYPCLRDISERLGTLELMWDDTQAEINHLGISPERLRYAEIYPEPCLFEVYGLIVGNDGSYITKPDSRAEIKYIHYSVPKEHYNPSAPVVLNNPNYGHEHGNHYPIGFENSKEIQRVTSPQWSGIVTLHYEDGYSMTFRVATLEVLATTGFPHPPYWSQKQ